jgi:lipopolysaccharide export system permease protein
VHDLPIPLPKIAAFRARGGRELEFTLPELYANSQNSALSPKVMQSSAANFYRRLVQSLILLILPPLALAMAIPPKRTSNATGLFFGLASLITYNELSEFAERTGAAGGGSPLLLQGIAFIIYALFCFWMFSLLAYRVAGQPLAIVYKLGSLALVPYKAFLKLYRRHA